MLGSGLTASQNTHAVNRIFSPSFIEALLFMVNHFTDKRWLEPRFMNESPNLQRVDLVLS